jgi:sodium/potassium-transporting ATPase subunit beta
MVLTDNEYVFENNHEVKVKHGRKSKLGMVMSLIWNPKTREFCGRDGVGWFRLSVFYAAFYFCLASFFIGMLAVFMQIMPTDRPSYYGDDSIMNARGCPLNPGMGFRPQIDVEDSLIMYDPSVGNDDELAKGYKRQTRNLKIFLESKYGELTGDLKELEVDCKANKSYDGHGKFCKFNPSELFASTDCTEAKEFGYNTTRPCVLLKLNKIYSWKPQAALGYITVNCSGEVNF